MEKPRILLVYNADGGLVGELSYFVKKALGTSSCQLCSITHAGVRERGAWVTCRATLDADVVPLHRNELSTAEKTFIDGRYPCVLSEIGGTLRWVATPEDFERLDLDPETLGARVNAHLAEHVVQTKD